MADIVNLGDKLKAQREATARLDLTAKMIPIMVETVEKVRRHRRQAGAHCEVSAGHDRRDQQR
jgi:hypothetical protein